MVDSLSWRTWKRNGQMRVFVFFFKIVHVCGSVSPRILYSLLLVGSRITYSIATLWFSINFIHLWTFTSMHFFHWLFIAQWNFLSETSYAHQALFHQGHSHSVSELQHSRPRPTTCFQPDLIYSSLF